jgi:hypothetical protein
MKKINLLLYGFVITLLVVCGFILPQFVLADTQTLVVTGVGSLQDISWYQNCVSGGDYTNLNSNDGITSFGSGVIVTNSFKFSNFNTPYQKINSVTLYTASARSGYSVNITHLVRIAGVNYNGSAQTVNGSGTSCNCTCETFYTTSYKWTTNPATGLSWTAYEITNAEWGWSQPTGPTKTTYLSLVVDYTPATGLTVTTEPATSITQGEATLNGTITYTGGENASERGFDWGLTTSYGSSWTETGSFGTGAFSRVISGLDSNTTYYFRAKARNSTGWVYGPAVAFTTLAYTQIKAIEGEGSQTQCSYVGGAGNYTNLNSDDGSTSVIKSSGYGPFYHCWNFQDFTIPVQSITSVTLTHKSWNGGGSGSTQITTYVRIGGTNYYGDIGSAGSSLKIYSMTWSKNPATGLTWSTSDLNNAQFGIRFAGSTAISEYTTYAYLTITYIPPSVIPPPAPTLVSPDDGAYVSGTSVIFQWNEAERATKYRLEVNTDPSWGTATRKLYQEVGNVTQYTDTGYPDNGTTYYWRVWAGNYADWCSDSEANSNKRSFINLSVPPAPILVSPANNDTAGGNHSVIFQWNEAERATKYRLEVNTDPSWGTATRKLYQEVGNVTQYTDTGYPDNGTTYYWRVWAGNAHGWGSSSEGWKFLSALKPDWINQYGTPAIVCDGSVGTAYTYKYKGTNIVVNPSGDPYAGGVLADSWGACNCCGGSTYYYMLAVGYNKETGIRKWLSIDLPSGLQQGVWAKYMAAGPDGNIYALSSGDEADFYKYNSNTGLASGFPKFIYQYAVPGGQFNKMAISEDGYVYGVGYYSGGTPPSDYTYNDFLMKLDPVTGNKIWTKQYSTQFHANFYDLTIDESGNIYVLGNYTISGGAGTFPHYFAKYNSSGTQLWAKNDIFRDNVRGNLFTDGTYIYITRSDFTRKYDLNGNQQSQSLATGGTKMIFDSQDNIFINIGETSVKKYDSNFNLIWSLPITAEDLAIDGGDNFYVYDGVTTVKKYDSDGNWIWTGSSLLFTGQAFTVDKSNQAAYITGYVTSADGLGTDIVTAKFSAPSANPPKVTTDLATIVDLPNNKVTLNGTITDDGGATVDQIRFHWSNTEGGPYTTTACSKSGTFAGTFSCDFTLTGIISGNTNIYYYKAQAHNSGGWSDLNTTNERRVVIYLRDGGQQEFISNSSNPPYKPTNTEETWDNCSFEGVSKVTLSWKYSDPDGDLQDSYRVLIDNNSDFSSPEIDSCNGSDSNCSTGITATSFTPISNLSWSTTYYWKVKVKDSEGNWSEYSDSKPFTTIEHAYPSPKFSFDPQKPDKDEEISFYNETVYFGQQPTYRWEFGDGTISYEYEPKHTYTVPSDYSVVLYARDEVGECSYMRIIKIASPLPWWKEIIPKLPL